MSVATEAGGGDTEDEEEAGIGPEDLDPEELEELTTDIEVETHIHFGMTGSFPLEIAELFFADDGLHIVEYGHIMPLFGLGAKRHRREARGMQKIFDNYGIDEVILQADTVVWLNYDAIDRVEFYTGRWLGRPKVAVYAEDGRSWAYRLHDDPDPEALMAELEATADRFGFDVETHEKLGYSLSESLYRFRQG